MKEKKPRKMSLPSRGKHAVGNILIVIPRELGNDCVSVVLAFTLLMALGSTIGKNYLFSE